MTFADYRSAVEGLFFGKRLPTAMYVYNDAEIRLPEPLESLVGLLRKKYAATGKHNLIKFHTESFKVSLLWYPDFFNDPHPALAEAVVADLTTGDVKVLCYGTKTNPPILHRKETMLPMDHPKAATYARLTQAEEKAGLYAQPSRIGFKITWERLLADKGLVYEGHTLVKQILENKSAQASSPKVHRHRTAMARTELSKPLRDVLTLQLMPPASSFFDYGCGRGSDVERLRDLGFVASGWDPVHAPNGSKREADTVNLGFVLNVIEDPAERVETLLDAWRLAKELLIVSTMVEGQEGIGLKRDFLDGIITSRGTFQKYFGQTELQLLIEETLHTDADAIGLGIFLVFRDPTRRQQFLFSRIQRDLPAATVHQRILKPVSARTRKIEFDELYTQHHDLLDAFWSKMLTLGRLPTENEFDRITELRFKLGCVLKLVSEG